MRALHPDLQAHLEGEATTVCLAWIVERKDDVTLGFTDHDRPLDVMGVVCEPSTGMTAGAAQASLGLSGDISDVSGALASDKIDQSDIERGVYDGADVALYLVNWQAPETASLLRRFHIGEIVREGPAFRAELRSLSSALDQPRGRFFTRQCDAQLGDARCKFDPAGVSGYAGTGAVETTDGARVIELSGISAFADQWYDQGTLRFDTGARAGDTLVISTARASQAGLVRITLRDPVGAAPDQGDQVTVFAGCDKRFATCKAKFANQLNFRGFPHMPGDDRALGYLRQDDLFDGGPLVP